MATLFADENVPRPLTAALRTLGHDVLTAHEAGRANQGIPDADVLVFAASVGRAVLTNNRWDYHRLHTASPNHAGIVTFSDDPDSNALAQRIHARLGQLPSLAGQLVKVTQAG
jgi:hypothetical protein